MNLDCEDFKSYGAGIIGELETYAASRPGWSIAPSNYEGIRVNLDGEHGNGWFLLRLSLHEPLMPLNIESDEAGGVKKIAGELSEFILRWDRLDSSSLISAAKG